MISIYYNGDLIEKSNVTMDKVSINYFPTEGRLVISKHLSAENSILHSFSVKPNLYFKLFKAFDIARELAEDHAGAEIWIEYKRKHKDLDRLTNIEILRYE